MSMPAKWLAAVAADVIVLFPMNAPFADENFDILIYPMDILISGRATT
jgi:hypothetical protein